VDGTPNGPGVDAGEEVGDVVPLLQWVIDRVFLPIGIGLEPVVTHGLSDFQVRDPVVVEQVDGEVVVPAVVLVEQLKLVFLFLRGKESKAHSFQLELRGCEPLELNIWRVDGLKR